MTTFHLTVHFDIDAQDMQHAVFLLNKELKEKGIHQGTEIELSPGKDGEMRIERRFGYTSITVEA